MPRCPNGSRRNKKTGKCERKSTSKKCPEGKRLNPKTNRCIKIKMSSVKKVSALRAAFFLSNP